LAAAIAMNGELKGFAGNLRGVQGAAKRAADEMDAGLGGSFRLILSAMQEVAIAIGDALSNELQSVVEKVTEYLRIAGTWVATNQGIVVSILKITAAITVAGAAMITAGLAVTALGLALGGMATVLSTAVAAFGLMASAISTIFTPMVGLIAVTGAAIGYIVHATGIGRKAINWLADVFGSLRDDAVAAWGAIAESLAKGDIGKAAEIAWMTLKLQWQKGVNYLESTWIEFKGWFLNIWTDMFYGAAKVAQNVWSWIVGGWIKAVYAINQAWTSFTSGFETTWNDIVAANTKSIHDWQYRLGQITADELNTYYEMVDQQRDSKNKAVERRRDSDLADTEEERQAALDHLESERSAAITRLDNAAKSAVEKRNLANAEKLEQSQKELDKARSEWEESIGEVQRQSLLDDMADDLNDGTAPEVTLPDQPDVGGLLGALENAPKAIADSMERFGVFGSFSAAALKNLGLGDQTSDTKRTADGVEKLVQQTEETNRKLDNLGMEFS
jgi:hypothetical protein